MTEAEFIKKIQILKQVKPREDWVILTKKQILDKGVFETKPSLFELLYSWKPAFAGLAVLFVLAGTSVLSQNALPGDILYPLKKIAERGQTMFASGSGKNTIQLEFANKRLEELTRIAQSNQTQKLAPAINEFQASTVEAAKNLNKIANSEKNPKMVKEVAIQAQKLEEQKKTVKALGVVVGDSKELNNALKELVEREIKEAESRSLSEAQAKILEDAKSDFNSENYSEALVEILSLSQQ